jgi:dolichol-phosphate mannosyltransferase
MASRQIAGMAHIRRKSTDLTSVTFPPAVELAVVIPTFGDRDNIAPVLGRLSAALQGIRYEVIFVDDDSPDGTAELIRRLANENPNVRLIQRVKRCGRASACVEGMLSTAAPLLAVMDADVRHDEWILPEMVNQLRGENADLVVGWARSRSLGAVSRFLNGFLCRREIKDPASSFFALRREFFLETVHRMAGIEDRVLLDLLASASRKPKIGELPYTPREEASPENRFDCGVLIGYLQLLLERLIGSVIPSAFVLFALVGAAGAAVYFGVFTLALFTVRLSFDVAQTVAAAAAMTVNFFLNNAITFRGTRLRGRQILRGLASFYAACSIGMWINLKMADTAGALGTKWYTAGLLGLGAGSVWNYGVTQFFTWRRHKQFRLGRSKQIGWIFGESAFD